MRKVLIAAVAALVLFVVGAFAASFALNSEDIASGNDAVTSCATKVDVDFTTMYNNNGDWTVTGANVKFYDGTGPTTACQKFNATLAVHTSASPSTPAVTASATVAPGGNSVVISFP